MTIVDAREAFARSPRYARHAEVVVDWPDRYLAGRELGPRDAVLVFTHDPKFDEPALVAALASGAGYVGALGSRRTHADRTERLRHAGVSEEDLAAHQLAVRARRGRADAGGDRDRGARRDPRPARAPRRRPPGRRERADPPAAGDRAGPGLTPGGWSSRSGAVRAPASGAVRLPVRAARAPAWRSVLVHSRW